jgi:hypothetical protein
MFSYVALEDRIPADHPPLCGDRISSEATGVASLSSAGLLRQARRIDKEDPSAFTRTH